MENLDPNGDCADVRRLMLGPVITNAVNRMPWQAYCFGCHGSEPFHVGCCRSDTDPTEIRAYSLRRHELGMLMLDQLRRELRFADMPYREERLTWASGPILMIRFQVPA